MSDTAACLFSTEHVPWPWFRQTDGGMGLHNNVQFLLNEYGAHESEWLAVFDAPPAQIETSVPWERRILVITEPPEVRPYPSRYLRQFGIILSPFHLPGARPGSVRVEGACLNWHYGVRTVSGDWQTSLHNLEAIRNLPVPPKRKMLSVICSTKTYTRAQRDRIAFVEKLVKRFGASVDVFGRGRNPVNDKADAIADYKYHIVLENNLIANFWTEKLSDAWIGYSLPLYAGAPNIEAHLPDPGGLVRLPLQDHETCFTIIEKLLDTDPYESRLPAIIRCREWCLEQTNVFSCISRIINSKSPEATEKTPMPLVEHIQPPNRWEIAVMRRFYRYGLLRKPE